MTKAGTSRRRPRARSRRGSGRARRRRGQAQVGGSGHPDHPHDGPAYLLFFSNNGKGTGSRPHEVPMKERTARGTAIGKSSHCAGREDQAIIANPDYPEDRFSSSPPSGQVKKTAFSEYDKSVARASSPSTLHDGDELVRVLHTTAATTSSWVSRNGVTIRSTDRRAAVGPQRRGVRACHEARRRVVSCDRRPDETSILIVTSPATASGRSSTSSTPDPWRPGRARHQLTAKKGYVVAAFMVALDDEIFVVSSAA